MAFVGWFEIAVGIAITAIWVRLLATDEVLELEARDTEMRFHIGVELLTAFLLMTSGIALLLDSGRGTTTFSALAVGALLYTTINSAGYYAQHRRWGAVAGFAVLLLATIAAGTVLVTER